MGDIFVLELTGAAHASLWSAAEILFGSCSTERQTFVLSNFANAVFCIVGSPVSPGIPNVNASGTSGSKGTGSYPTESKLSIFPEEGTTDVKRINSAGDRHYEDRNMASATPQSTPVILGPQLRLGVRGISRFRHLLPCRELQMAAANFLVCFSYMLRACYAVTHGGGMPKC